MGHLIPGAQRAVCAITEDTMLPGEAPRRSPARAWGGTAVQVLCAHPAGNPGVRLLGSTRARPPPPLSPPAAGEN